MKILAARSGDAPGFMAISSSSRLKIGTRNLSVIFKQSLTQFRAPSRRRQYGFDQRHP